MTFRLAHLTDPHLPLPRAGARDLMTKRILGWQSWHRRRKSIHLSTVLQAVIRDVHAHHPDQIAVTGDIGNISLPSEHLAARQWFETIDTPDRVLVVPGNHDAYVHLPASEGVALWGAYREGEDGSAPAIRRLAGVMLIGVDSAVPTPWLMSGGTVGPTQLEKLAAALEAGRAEGLCRIVLIHHPPVAIRGGSGRKALSDAEAFRATLARHGAEMVIHGHTHRRSLVMLDTIAGATPIVGAPSASANDRRHGDMGGWNLYEIERDGPGWRIAMTCREATTSGPMTTIATQSLSVLPR